MHITVRHDMCYGIKILRTDAEDLQSSFFPDLIIFKAPIITDFDPWLKLPLWEIVQAQRTRLSSFNAMSPHGQVAHQQPELQDASCEFF